VSEFVVKNDLCPIAALLPIHGVKRLYSTDSDFRKFEFLEDIVPLS